MFTIILLCFITKIAGQNLAELVKETRTIDNLLRYDKPNIIVGSFANMRTNEKKYNISDESVDSKIEEIITKKVFQLCDYMIREPSYNQLLDDSPVYQEYAKPFANQFGVLLNTLYNLVGENDFKQNRLRLNNFLKYFNNENPVDYIGFKYPLDERVLQIMTNLTALDNSTKFFMSSSSTKPSTINETTSVVSFKKTLDVTPLVSKSNKEKSTTGMSPVTKISIQKPLVTSTNKSLVTPLTKASVNKTQRKTSEIKPLVTKTHKKKSKVTSTTKLSVKRKIK